MKLHKIFRIGLVLSLATASLTSCHQPSNSSQAVEASKPGTPQTTQPIFPLQDKPRPTFQSDEQLKTNFQQHKAELLTLMRKCKSEQESQVEIKSEITQPFSKCVVDNAQLKSMNLKEIAVEFLRTQPIPSDFRGNRISFLSDYYKNDTTHTFVEEKGYLYSPTPLQQDVLQTGSLDQFAGQDLFVRKGRQEVWRYVQIEPNWYLYYRQYFYPFLG
ncbi:hypothetical protein IQ250_18090 [Pseudanabaenaceae cyanobacterium LEGE 13415]|nr:hypothetical protein [Pseudanabaenaceae cyanobacterium LEGE 13415]